MASTKLKGLAKYNSVLSQFAAINSSKKFRNFYTYTPEPAQPLPRKPTICTAEEALKCIQSNNIVFAQGAAATPVHLLDAMAKYGAQAKLSNVTVCHMHTEGEAKYTQKEYEGIFRNCSFFMGGNVRKAIAEGRGDAIPIFLHEIPKLFSRGIVKPDVALIHVTPPDAHGYCSLGTSVDCVREALTHSKIIIAQVNPNMPRTFGDALIHESHIDFAVNINTPLPSHGGKPPSDVETKIGKNIAENLVDDGATLQMGIGSIPDAVLSALGNHKDLGIHSEMFADGVVDLVEKGCITNNKKTLHKGRIVGSFLIGTQKLYDFVDNNPFIVLSALGNHKDLGIHSEMFADGVVDLVEKGCITNNKKTLHKGRIVGSFLIGTQKLYDFVDNNPFIEMLRIDYVNNTQIVSKLPKMTAINSCIEVDLTGQVCSDSIGTRMYSGFGGQVDFIRGAAEGFDGLGKPIIALPSATKRNETKIVPILKPGAGVVTSRAHVHYVVTEYGIASLFGKTLRQRAYELIQIAHPDHRESLEKAAFERLKVMPAKDR